MADWQTGSAEGREQNMRARRIEDFMIVNKATLFLTGILGTSLCHWKAYQFSLGPWIFSKSFPIRIHQPSLQL